MQLTHSLSNSLQCKGINFCQVEAVPKIRSSYKRQVNKTASHKGSCHVQELINGNIPVSSSKKGLSYTLLKVR